MYDNAIKCLESDYPTVLMLGYALGALDVDGSPVDGVAWDYIGYKRVGPQPADGQPDTRPFLDNGHGDKYVHVNVRTPFSVGARAAELAAGNPEIAGALSEIGRFFVVDGAGNSVMPEFPMRCFA
jgi:hypothetical protein